MTTASGWRTRPNRAAEWGTAAVTLAAMIATPLARRGGSVRRALSPVVVTALAATTSLAAGRRWGLAHTARAGAAVVAGTALVEGIGSRRGVPFGRYVYTDRLRPQVAGVPVVVPLAWWAMALPAREAAVAALGPHATRPRRIVAGAAALTAWDLFLDPQMVGEDFWRWARSGRYRTIPATNFAGWLVTSLAVMAALDVLLPAVRACRVRSQHPTEPDRVRTRHSSGSTPRWR